MMRRGLLGLFVAGLAANASTSCLGSESDGTDSNTSWASCDTDADCSVGEVCIEERCQVDPLASAATDAGTPISTTFGPPDDPQSVGGCQSPARSCSELASYVDELLGVPMTPDMGFGAGDLTVIVLFDRSASMGTEWDQRTRWQAASDALITSMAPYVDNLTVGAILFPDASECGVQPITHETQIDLSSGRDFVTRWVEAACGNQPFGNTPMEESFREADAAIAAAQDLGLLDERFRVVVVADGEPNCQSDPAALTAFAASWLALGIETWVIGIPGSEDAVSLLDDIAAAGGTGAHRAVAGPCELEDHLGAAVR